MNPDYWNASKQKAHPPNKENKQINTQLSLIKQDINQAFLFLQVQEKNFDVDDIYRQYKGENIKEDKSIMEIFNLHIAKQEKLIGISTTRVSVRKFYQTKTHVKTFIKWKFNKSDYLLKDMKMSFITEFEYYLKAEKKFEQNTIHKTLQRFKQVVKLAVGLDFLAKDPFLLHKNRKPKKQVIFLSREELLVLENYQFASIRLQNVADMFIFCCYTGLAYSEMANLKTKDSAPGAFPYIRGTKPGNEWFVRQDIDVVNAKDANAKVQYGSTYTGKFYDYLVSASSDGGHTFTRILINNEWVIYDANPPHA